MKMQGKKTIKISVRNLVEFIFRSGDLDNSKGGFRDLESMQAGSRIHRKIQKSKGSEYSSEVALSIVVPVEQEKTPFDICVEGRADGIYQLSAQMPWSDRNRAEFDEEFEEESRKPSVVVDEIKAVYMDLSHLENPVPTHRFQAMCYAYIYLKQNDLKEIGIQLTYCNIETEIKKIFQESVTKHEISEWFEALILEYSKWAKAQINWEQLRNQSIKQLDFPFPYRIGQKELVTDVYRTILRNKKLYIEAPTGVGKTVSTLFPTVKAVGEGEVSKIFYLTAKTITRTVAEETMQLLVQKGLLFKTVTITAKDKICILDKPDCNPSSCERAKGHYDRVNNAVFDLIREEQEISRPLIEAYAKKHQVCPFEMCLDVTLWADCIICDYNYVFDPNVYLRRFFADEKKKDYVFLIDEAHNLVERARKMYSAVLYKQQFLNIKRLIKTMDIKLAKQIDTCNADLVRLKRECDDCEVITDIQGFILHLMHLLGTYEAFMQEFPKFDQRDAVLELYFEIRHFLNMYELNDEKYITYTDYDDTGLFRINLQCMDPSTNLLNYLERGRSAIFFSATLLPIQYYKEQLAGKEEDYAVYAPSNFAESNRLLLVGRDVSTKYTRRNVGEYQKIADYIHILTDSKIGNYLVFFPSYQMMREVYELLNPDCRETRFVMQENNMTEEEREEFLSAFVSDPVSTRVGLCVMGGIFSEGIDLKNDRLIGTIIVGTGLPMVCNERELFRDYYSNHGKNGFEYAYLFPGMNKVLQSAGRVIRTAEDRGIILLLDDRFLNRQYQNMFPREWFPNITVDKETISDSIHSFWKGDTYV